MTEETKDEQEKKKKQQQPVPAQPPEVPTPQWQYRAVYRLINPADRDPLIEAASHQRAVDILALAKWHRKLARDRETQPSYIG